MADHIAVLPSEVVDAISLQLQHPTRFLRLPHPRTGVASLFLPYQRCGKRSAILEVHAVTPPNARSWFLNNEQVVEDGKLLVFTPIDPVFLLIPLLQAAYPENEPAGTFRPADDIFEQAISNLSKQARNSVFKDSSTIAPSKDMLVFTSLEFIPHAMKYLCEVKEITPEITVYRFSVPTLTTYLRNKISKLAASEVFKSSRSMTRGWAKDGLMEDGKESLLISGQTKAACDMISQHLPPNIRSALLATYDFADLHLYLNSLHDELVSLPVGDGKKTKKQPSITAGADAKKRKMKGSHGVEKLKKVNVDGMSKISSFFQKPK